MAHRNFDQSALSRRALLRGGAFLGAGAVLSAMPFGRVAMAHAGHWPSVQAVVDKYVGAQNVANMVAVMGFGQNAPDVVAKGTLAIGQPDAADMDSLYRIYSMTKPVTGIATMMLVEDGLLTLDQPLSDIIPAFKDMMVQAEPDGNLTDLVPLQRAITIRHLLTHTAGLGYGIVQKGPIAKAYADNGINPGKFSRLPIPGLSRAKPAESLEVFADNLATLPLVYQPGVKWSYSVSMDLLGRVIEVVSGKPFDTFLSERIFEPVGMNSTYFQVPDAQVARLTTNYGILNGTPLPIDPGANSIFLDKPEFPFGGAGLVASPADYDRFLRMLAGRGMIDGTRVMAEETVALATSNILPEGTDTANSFVDGEGFGAGGRIDRTGSFGWGGAAGTLAAVNVQNGFRTSLFTQYAPPESFPIRGEFIKAVMADLPTAMQNAMSMEEA